MWYGDETRSHFPSLASSRACFQFATVRNDAEWSEGAEIQRITIAVIDLPNLRCAAGSRMTSLSSVTRSTGGLTYRTRWTDMPLHFYPVLGHVRLRSPLANLLVCPPRQPSSETRRLRLTLARGFIQLLRLLHLVARLQLVDPGRPE